MVYKLNESVNNWHLALICSTISSSYILECKRLTLAISMLEIMPWAKSHLCSARPDPPTPPSMLGLTTYTCGGTLSRWKPMWQYMVTQAKHASWCRFHYSHMNWWSSFTCQRSFFWLKRPGIVTLVPNREELLRRCGQEDRAMKEAWEGQGPTEHKCDLA